ncbi:MAG TPA: M24 family metallopeptidase [Pyrinomonadaceae bacterium]|nr:M24 family metallopeptidase [Pyrinomonadaceae bacterium]
MAEQENAVTELEEKTERLTRMLAAKGLGGVLLTLQPNFSWLTGGKQNLIDTSRESVAGALLVRSDGKRFVVANRIEMPRLLDEEVSATDFEPVDFPWEEEKSSGTFVADRAGALLNDGQPLGSDTYLNGGAQVIEGDVSACRYKLTAAEIERFRALGKDAGEVIGKFMKTLEPGETEKDIAIRAAETFATRDMQTVVLLVAADERIQKYRHPTPTGRVWEKNLMVVVCARRNGLIASLSRLICRGPVTPDLARRTLAAAQVNAQLFAATRPGATGPELFDVAVRSYAETGFPNEEHRHHQGGACGYRTRDWMAHPNSREIVEINQAFAWNPTVTGTKCEETCIAFENGVEVITSSPDWPSISVEAGAKNYSLSDILSI